MQFLFCCAKFVGEHSHQLIITNVNDYLCCKRNNKHC